MSFRKPRTQHSAPTSRTRFLRPRFVAFVALLALCLLPYFGHAFSSGALLSWGEDESLSALAFDIKGTVTTPGGAPIGDVQIRVTGDSGLILTTTAADGTYTVNGLTGGRDYTVTPSKGGFVFTPANRVFTNLSANQENANFVGATAQAFNIRGTITTTGGAALADVQVRVTSDGSSDILVTTDGDGLYVVNGLTGGRDYTVTPSKGGFVFTPANRVFTNLSANQENANFVGAAGQAFQIKGTVTAEGGAPLGDVQVRITGDSSVFLTTTANDGTYFINGLTGGRDYTVTPSKSGLTFTPANRVFTNLSANQENANFVGSATQAFFIKGTVVDQNGAPVSDVQLRVTGDSSVFLTTTAADGTYTVNGLAGGRDYTVTPSKSGLTFTPASRVFTNLNANQNGADFTVSGLPNPTPTPTPVVSVHFESANLFVSEGVSAVQVLVTREGDNTGTASVNYATVDGTATATSDYTASYGTLRFEVGEIEKAITVFITDDVYGEGPETFSLTLSDPVSCSIGTPASVEVTINSNEAADGPNPMRVATFNAEYFVRRHYIDFFNREADAPGLAFWVGQIESCGADAACREDKKVNVSGAFFVSIEFQQTGYLVYRAHQASFNTGEHLKLRDFLPDTQEIGRGVVIGQPGADELLEQNRATYFNRFVTRPSFLALYPTTLPAGQFIDALNANTGGSLSQAERDDLANRLAAGTITRAEALRAVAQDADFRAREFNRAFVLMQYFGYLRRNPNDPPEIGLDFTGYNFWLQKLNDNNGNFVAAEMVKAFINSEEYKKRFGP